MKTLVIISIVLLIIVVLAIEAMKWWNRILFKINFKGVDISTIDLASLTSLGQTSGKLIIGVNIINGNSFSIPFNKMKVFLYYDNTLIAESSGALYDKSFNIAANGGHVDITDNVNVHINSASAKLIKDAISKKNPKVNYSVKLSVFGIPLTYSDYFVASI